MHYKSKGIEDTRWYRQELWLGTCNNCQTWAKSSNVPNILYCHQGASAVVNRLDPGAGVSMQISTDHCIFVDYTIRHSTVI